jgi:hypothetical protein
MSCIFPSRPPHLHALTAGEYAELNLLHILEQGLSDAYTVFHSVDWSRGKGEEEQHGEIDLVLINQAGAALMMEVKAGHLEFTDTGIYKTYHGKAKNIAGQVGLQYGAMRARLADASLHISLSHWLVLPDVKVRSETAQWPRSRIVDSSDITTIISRITELLGPGLADEELQTKVVAFFGNRFKVEPDVSALTGSLTQAATRLSAGLATWVPRISTPDGVIQVTGTAGSGKTQLALHMLRAADAAGLRAAYLCFNRALADHMARVLPARVPAETFHEYARRIVAASGSVPNYGAENAFDAMASQSITLLEQSAPDLDLLVLDEMQDMQPDWVTAMIKRVKDIGQVLLLEDPEQSLYADREAFSLPEVVSVKSFENFRTPRALVRLINLLRLTATEVQALSPHDGDAPDPLIYADPSEVTAQTQLAVERCKARGFALSDIVVISMRGMKNSALLNIDRLGPWTLKRFTGNYDEGSNAIWTRGELLIDTVRRFKGQAAPAVVLTECDMADLSDINRRLLFVGLTRARVHLEWVMSSRNASLLSTTIGE